MTDDSAKRRLASIQIPAPCGASWDEMRNEGANRHCDSCGKPVHDLGELTDDEAAALLDGRGGVTPCVRLRRDPDGVVLTRSEQHRRLFRVLRSAQRLKAEREGERGLSYWVTSAPTRLQACRPMADVSADCPWCDRATDQRADGQRARWCVIRRCETSR